MKTKFITILFQAEITCNVHAEPRPDIRLMLLILLFMCNCIHIVLTPCHSLLTDGYYGDDDMMSANTNLP